MKIVVTGANGYIGRHVVNALIKFGHDITAVDICSKDPESVVKVISLDVLNSDENLYEKLGKPDAIVHLAWQDGFVHNAFSHIEKLPLHFNFINKMAKSGVSHFLVMGSMHEVGYFEGAITESTPTNPTSLYGIAKNSLRQALDVLFKDKDVCFQWIRAFYIFGDDRSNHSIFTKLLEMEASGQTLFPFTDGNNKYDFEHISILAEQIAAVVSQKEITGIINCCSGQPVKLKDKIEEFLKLNNLKIKLDYGKYPSRPYDSPIIYGDNTKIQKIMSAKNVK